jgi:hypothetical protein
MSAYDNPTIIKDDSAMIWAQSLGNIGQSFTESYNIARKEREAKEKEARLEAERKEKDRKDLAISRQIFYSKNAAAISEENSKNRSNLQKKGVNQSITDQLLGFYEQSQTKIGENTADATFSEIDKTKLVNDAKYASQVNTLWANANTMLGGGGAQVKAIYDGEIGKLNAERLEYIGDDDITRLTNAIIPSKLASDKNIVSNLKYNIDNPDEGMQVNTRVDGMTRAELETYISGVNPEITRKKEVDNFIKSNKNSIEDNGNGTYNIIRNEDIADRKTGEFYVIIPEPKKDTDLQTAGIYNDKDQLQEVFFEGPMYVNAQGNAGISKNEALVKVPKRLIKMEDINTLIEKQVNTNIKGLLGSELQDMNKLRGFMRMTGSGGTGVEDAKNIVTKGLDEQVKVLSAPIIESYKLELMRNNNIRLDKDGKYYQLDEMALKEFDSNQSKNRTRGGMTAAQAKAEANLENTIQRVWDMQPNGTGNFKGVNGVKVSHSMGNFIIETPGDVKGQIFETKQDVVEYLKNGSYNPKQ